MKFGLMLFGILIGAAGYFIGETIGLGLMGLGAILLLWGLFSRKKQYYAGQSYGNQRMMMNTNPNQNIDMRRI